MKNKREIGTIDRILQIIRHPSMWTKGASARDAYKDPVYYQSKDASCWCLDGAIHLALTEQNLTNRKWKNSYHKITHAICKAVGLKFDIGHQDEHMGFNDHPLTTHPDILNALHNAKEILQGKPHE